MIDVSFLKSNRFWALVIGAVAVYLEAKGFIGEAERNLIAIISTSFITVRTIDRATEITPVDREE